MQWQFSAGKRLLGMFREKYGQLARCFSKEPEEFAVQLLELGVIQRTCLKAPNQILRQIFRLYGMHDQISFPSISTMAILLSDQLSDRLIFGRLFQADEKLSTFRSCANL